MLADEGPDAVAQATHAVVTRLEECLEPEGITLLSTDLGSDGAGFFLASGVPHSSEDDEGRMLRALKRFVDSDLPLKVQAGCNRGHVFVAELGAPDPRRVLGDGRHHQHGRAHHVEGRARACSTRTPSSSSTRARCSRPSRPARSR